MSYSKFRPRRGTTLQWEEANTLLNEGEIAFEFANRIGDGEAKVKIGDGVNRWNDLPYAVNVDEIRATIEEMKSKLDESDSKTQVIDRTKLSIDPYSTEENVLGCMYPDGFTRDNCIVTGVKYGYRAGFYGYEVPSVYYNDAIVEMTEDNLKIHINGNGSSSFVDVKIILTKIS